MKDKEVLSYILSLEKRGVLFGLENITSILRAIKNPEKAYSTVHIGGTNGKGSVAKVLSSILTFQGFRCGRYTSPHLHIITERFSVNEREMEYDEFVEISMYVWERIENEKIEKSFSFFDFTTAVAFEYFRRRSVEIALIEVGLGGRLDSTNVITPLVSVITNVTYDHMDYLGNKLSSIAKEKAGIIKEGVPVVTGAQGLPLRIIKASAKKKNSPIYVFGRNFFLEKVKERVMNYKGIKWNLENLYVNLLGDHQLFNVSLALCVLEILSEKGFPVCESTIRFALENVQWMGRLEIVREKPKIILDGAHNVAGIKALTEYMKNLSGKKKVCIFGVMKDKDFKGMAKLIRMWANEIIITRPSLERSLCVEELKKVLPFALPTQSVKEALDIAKKIAEDEDVIVVTGSLFTVAEARSLVNEVF